jgi:hypothetical protein
MAKINLEQVLKNNWNKLFEQTEKEENIKDIKKDYNPDGESEIILTPFDFLAKYSIEPLTYIGIEFSYELSEVQKTREQFTNSGEIGIKTTNVSNKEIAKQANLVEENVISFLKKFKQRAIEFANDDLTPETFAISFNWIPKASPEENYRLTISVKNENGKLLIKDVGEYTISIDRIPKPIKPISKFIKDNKKYIKNSPFRLLASILIYNDWKYNWNLEIMQKKENLDKRLLIK